MRQVWWKYVLVFFLGMFVLILGYSLTTIFGGFRRPTRAGIIEDYQAICFWYDDVGSMQVSVSPQGCYSTTCTRQVSKEGSVVVDRDIFQISIDTQFVLAETSRFPFPCTDNCSGGGTVNFDIGALQVGKYEVLYRGEKAGELSIFSGLPTPRQCFEFSSN
jgi:hypothetical protein